MYNLIKAEDSIPSCVSRVLTKFIPNTLIDNDHIAITIFKNKVVSIGRNSDSRTHPVQAKYAKRTDQIHKQRLHAEISALVKARSKIDAIYVFRISKTGEWKYSLPCKICQLALNEANVKCFHS